MSGSYPQMIVVLGVGTETAVAKVPSCNLAAILCSVLVSCLNIVI